MNRSSLNDFRGLNCATRNRRRTLTFQPLEERKLLSADLVISTYDQTAIASTNYSVLRYNPTSQTLVGSAETGDHGLAEASGVAVAADGSYYVNSFQSGQVLHFSGAGTFLNVLGANDAVHPLMSPGTLAFGPDGNLYVADLYANAVFQFDVNSTTQQFQPADTLSLPAGSPPDIPPFTPGGFTFAADGTNDLIVAGLGTQSVLRYHNGVATALVAPGSGYEVSSMVSLRNGDLLLADFDADYVTSAHHQVLEYAPPTGTATVGTVTQFIDLSQYPQYGNGAADPTQPLAMMLDTDGNLLVGVSPDHSDHGAVLKFNINTAALMGAVATGIGTPSGLEYAPLRIPASAWTSAGLTIAETPDGMLHVYTTRTTYDVIAPQSAASVSGIDIDGLTNPSYTLAIDASNGNPVPFAGIAFTNGDACSYSVQSGTIGPNLTGAGSLTITGPGMTTLMGTNAYQNGTIVAGGTLVVTSAASLSDGTMLTVGDGSAFSRVSTAVPPTVARAASAATFPVAAPLPSSSASTIRIADEDVPSPRGVGAVWTQYGASAAGYWFWLDRRGAVGSSPAESLNDRLAALAAVMAEYGAA